MTFEHLLKHVGNASVPSPRTKSQSCPRVRRVCTHAAPADHIAQSTRILKYYQHSLLMLSILIRASRSGSCRWAAQHACHPPQVVTVTISAYCHADTACRITKVYEYESYDYPTQVQESIVELGASVQHTVTAFAATNLKACRKFGFVL